MILYKYQLVRTTHKEKVLIYLGFDKTAQNKIWVVKLNDKGLPEVDWWMLGSLSYIQVKTDNKALPGALAIGFGKFKNNKSEINHNFYPEDHTPDAELMGKFAEYLKEIKEKVIKSEQEVVNEQE